MGESINDDRDLQVTEGTSPKRLQVFSLMSLMWSQGDHTPITQTSSKCYLPNNSMLPPPMIYTVIEKMENSSSEKVYILVK